MKKRILFFIAATTLSVAVFVSCKKDKDINSADPVTRTEQLSGKTAQKGVSSSSFGGEQLHMNFETASLANPDLRNAFGCFPGLQDWLSSLSPEVLAALFEDYPWLKGYVINVSELIENYHTSVFVVVDGETDMSVGIIRKWKGTTENGKFTGELLLTDLSNNLILQNQYSEGKRISEKDNFNDWVENGVACKPNAGGGNFFGHCTRAQFNAAYQHAKNECESDFLCDIACSLNPCWISYLASAMIDCR